MRRDIGGVADVPAGEVRRFGVDGVDVAVVNLGEGVFLGLNDLCSHAEASLSEGEVDVLEETIECPRHGSRFDLRSGKPRSLPATHPVRTFRIEVEGDRLIVEAEG